MNIEERIRLKIMNRDTVQGTGIPKGTDYLVSIDDPDIEPTRCFDPCPENHKHFQFHDVALLGESPALNMRDGLVPPSKEHVKALIEHFEKIKADPKRPVNVVVQCYAGISRSSAAGLILLLVLFGHEKVGELMDHVSSVGNNIWPNERMLLFAEELLGCEGRVNTVVDAWKAFMDNRNRSLFG